MDINKRNEAILKSLRMLYWRVRNDEMRRTMEVEGSRADIL
jgi:hypothetical protein